jgi:uncharacterized protein (TIGR03437 family)
MMRWYSICITLTLLAMAVQIRAQNVEWIRQFGSANSASVMGLASDDGGIYAAGQVRGVLAGQVGVGGDDAFLARFDQGGTMLFMRQFGSSRDDRAIAVVADEDTVYVVGLTAGSLPGFVNAGGNCADGCSDAFVRRYDSNGNILWARQFGVAGNDSANAVAASATGIYVGGYTSGGLDQSSAGGEDAFIRKYDRAGNVMWSRQFGIPLNESAWAVATSADAVYVAGNASKTINQVVGDAFVRKYHAETGDEMWSRQFSANNTATANGLAVDSTGVYVVGLANNTLEGQASQGGSEDGYIRKYDADGNELWTRQFGTPGNDEAEAIAVFGSGIYVAGQTTGSFPGFSNNGSFDAYVQELDPSGATVWTFQFGSTDGDFVDGLVSKATALYLGGGTFGTLPSQAKSGTVDAYVAKLTIPPPPSPAVNDGGVVNNASYALDPAPVAPGSIAAVFGTNLNDGSTVLASTFGTDGKLVTMLGGASVTVNDIAAPIFYSTPNQLGIQIPNELVGHTSATVQVTVAGQTSIPKNLSLGSFVPGIFTANQQGIRMASALHQDGATPITLESAARRGEVISLFATGLGTVVPPLATGAPSDSNATATAATVTIDGLPAQVTYSGTASGFVGLNQVNVSIPLNTRTGPDIPVVLSIGGKQSNTVTIPISD